MAKKGVIKLSELLQGQKNLAGISETANYRPGSTATPVENQRVTKDEFLRILQDMQETAKTPAVAPASRGAQRIFEEFIRQTERREELLKDATEEQIAIFKELESTILKLRTASHDDSKALRKTIDDLGRKLGQTKPTAARGAIAAALPAPYTPPSYAKPLEEAAGPMFTGSGLDKGVDAEGAEAAGSSGAGGILESLGSGLGKLLEGLGLYKLAKRFSAPGGAQKTAKAKTSTRGGSKVLVDEKGVERERKPGTKYEKNGRYYEIDKNGKARPIKTPGAAERARIGAKGVGGRIGLLAPLYAISDAVLEYEQTGNLTKSLVSGTAGLGGGILGEMAAGPAGGIGGALAGSIAGEKINERIEGDPIKDTARSLLKNVQDFAHSANQVIPKAMENVSNTIKNLSSDNAEKKTPKVDVGTPTIVNNYSNNTTVPPNIITPMAALRPTESAFNRHQFRNYQT